MEDIAPKLLEQIQDEFAKNVQNSGKVSALIKKLQNGTNYEDAGDYAYYIGKALADAFSAVIQEDVLPDGKMYWNIAQRVIEPMLKADYDIVSEYAEATQAYLNELGDIGLKVQKASFDTERAKGIMDAVCAGERYTPAVGQRFLESVINFSQHVTDETMKRNVEFQAKSGMHPKVIRRTSGKVCKWCRALAGTYEYPDDVPDDFYRRHENCRCVVEYYPGSGKRRQNVWDKKWREVEKHNPESPVENSEKSGIIISSKQFGKKIGKHTSDFGMNPASEKDRTRMKEIILDIMNNYDELQIGEWRGQRGESEFYIKGNDVVVVNNKEFVTILKGGCQ